MFKNNHNLERSASYPKSQKYVYGVLFIILLAESILNGYVLSKAQDTGYFGGVFLARRVFFFGKVPYPSMVHNKTSL